MLVLLLQVCVYPILSHNATNYGVIFYPLTHINSLRLRSQVIAKSNNIIVPAPMHIDRNIFHSPTVARESYSKF